MSLVGKVISNQSEPFLVLEERDRTYTGHWVAHPRKPELEEVQKQGPRQPLILANSLEEFITKGAIKKADIEAKRKYVNKVCADENFVIGIVTSYVDGVCYGSTLEGTEWHCQEPSIVGTDLCDYVKKNIEKAVRAAI